VEPKRARQLSSAYPHRRAELKQVPLTAIRQWRILKHAVRGDAYFLKLIRQALHDDEYRTLQVALLLRPEQGALIPGTGSLHKIRWGGKGHGKSGGFRLIYYWDKGSQAFYMLYLYPKNEQENFTPQQAKILRQLVEKEFR
jgi:mRNA-degrading endonuclease RelE of RelBE toxin-antitoxin system